ncbi:uncharacterized protein PGTG_21493 [Puccinia graminis f. sp. tritici CRL 75-36-700-3]|uniref:Uncharacterized protein n=1 Tax=Puccinia graminis f. sp. tritici (strain CRL 75-36-700-3 / race SCCL) TaxID=418459 RepID=H6QRK6_PUCGT|nr:uncharacterized protein PGTG_21493 [Puccinia graminis f. sp. tritici CRL 75-36-700-3]EHS63277.1 hypothetical protein PGTG_21493 [Puccinia graminis f. sp. tritici CRL 75-36-700-3]
MFFCVSAVEVLTTHSTPVGTTSRGASQRQIPKLPLPAWALGRSITFIHTTLSNIHPGTTILLLER